MFANEAVWLRDRLLTLDPSVASPILNVGSGDRAQRERSQPYMTELLFGPLAAKGFRVLHCDLLAADGVDLPGDLLDDGYLAEMRAQGAGAVLCNNFYEHVDRREEYATRLLGALEPGSHLLVTVPLSYPYHSVPIDTLYRPSPDDLAALHAGTDVIDKAVIYASRYRDQVKARPSRLARDLALAAQTVVQTRSTRHVRLRWWNRPYSVSGVHLVKR